MIRYTHQVLLAIDDCRAALDRAEENGMKARLADKVMTDGRVYEHIGWRMLCTVHNSNLVYEQRKKADSSYDVHTKLEDCNHAVVVPAYRRKMA